jgi:hypothetical protein
MRRAFAEADFADRLQLVRLAFRELASRSGPLDRVRALATFVGAGKEFMLAGNTAVCEAAARLGERLGVGHNVSHALNEVAARWDGKLFPLPPRVFRSSPGSPI